MFIFSAAPLKCDFVNGWTYFSSNDQCFKYFEKGDWNMARYNNQTKR